MHLPEFTPEHFSYFVQYMYRPRCPGYVDVPQGTTLEDACVNAWETMAQLSVLASRLGAEGLVFDMTDTDKDGQGFARALPGLGPIQLAWSMPDVRLDDESYTSVMRHAVEAWPQRGKYEDYMPLEQELPARFNMDLLRFKIGKRNEQQAQVDGANE